MPIEHDLISILDEDSAAFTVNSKYINMDEIGSICIDSRADYKFLTLMHLNIQGLVGKIDHLKELIDDFRSKGIFIHVIMLCETFLSDVSATVCDIPGYSLICNNRRRLTKGGVAMYISNELSYNRLTDCISIDTEFETIAVEVSHRGKRFYCAEVYRVPNINEQLSVDRYNEFLSYFRNKRDVYIGTDQNFDLLKCNVHANTNTLLNTFTSYGYMLTATKPTRVTHRTATLIDNIYIKTSHTTSHRSGIIITDISDHFPVIYTSEMNINHFTNAVFKRRRPIKKEHFAIIEEEWRSLNWDCLTTKTLTDAFDIFHTLLISTLNKYAPITERNTHKHNYLPWLTKALRKSIHKKAQLYKQSLKHPKDHPKCKKYLTYKTCLNKVLRTAKNSYYYNQLKENCNNTKKTWKTINSMIKKTNNKQDIKEILHNGTTYNSNYEIAEQFNKYFSTVGSNQAAQIATQTSSAPPPPISANEQSLFLTPTHEYEIQQLITRLKNKPSSGYDYITALHLKQMAPFIITPLTILFNRCLTEGEFPKRLKHAKIIPIHKKQDTSLLSNYRPISLLPSLSKILEKLIATRFISFLTHTDALDTHQYGFRPKQSTTDAITQLIGHIISNKEQKHITLATFLDFSKAFDTIKHDTLLHKLHQLGIRGTPQTLIQSYLKERTQHTEVNGHLSPSIHQHPFGVPQGSILGPLLFIIYINNIRASLSHTQHLLYADDTTLYISGTDLNTLQHEMNSDLQSIHNWCQHNSLFLNTQKSKCMLFQNTHKQQTLTTPSALHIHINGTRIEHESETDFLGITITDNLSWAKHITKISKKISHGLYALNRTKHTLPKLHRQMIYNALIESHLTYGITLWGYAQKQHLKRLSTQQKKAIRYITNAPHNSHTDPLFKSCKILKLPDLIKLHTIKLMHKIIQHTAPPHIQSLFPHRQHNSPPQTRQLDVQIPLFRSSSCQNTILYHGPQLLHTLPSAIKSYLESTSKTLARHYKAHILNSYLPRD